MRPQENGYGAAAQEQPDAHTPEQRHYRRMTQTPVPRLVAQLAAPTIVSMLVSAVYNMADTFFVSQLGTSAAGAVGIVFSLMAIIQGPRQGEFAILGLRAVN